MSAETYKGIEFIRIANLPDEQKTHIKETIDHSKIIKILKGKELLSDCIQVVDYADWMKAQFNQRITITPSSRAPYNN